MHMYSFETNLCEYSMKTLHIGFLSNIWFFKRIQLHTAQNNVPNLDQIKETACHSVTSHLSDSLMLSGKLEDFLLEKFFSNKCIYIPVLYIVLPDQIIWCTQTSVGGRQTVKQSNVVRGPDRHITCHRARHLPIYFQRSEITLTLHQHADNTKFSSLK